MEYAAVQQFGAVAGALGRNKRGSPIPWGNIPARPFLGVSAQDKVEVLEILQEALLGAAGAK
jgi:phage gpG-like protein